MPVFRPFAALGVAIMCAGVVAWQEREMPLANAAVQAAQDEEGLEVLTRGPVHEAFGKPVSFDPEPGIIVKDAPPDPIEEMPPEQKPEGDNIVWIKGYWGWEPDEKRYIWISGFYRDVPPERQWYPGYWHKVDDGYQWISGFWGTIDARVTYQPDPPESLEVGPSTDAPSAEHMWAPGCWMWHDTRYVWRAGFWYTPRTGWTYVPCHYVWTPSGCIHVSGFWDRSIRRRGLLTCPVHFTRAVYTRPDFVYIPRAVVNINLITDHFFCYPKYHHYCFGDYYAQDFVRIGIYPWFSFHYSRGYDPTFAYYHWYYSRRDGRDGRWLDGVRERYRRHREDERSRPPRTLADQRRLLDDPDRLPREVRRESLELGRTLAQVAEMKDPPVRLSRVEERERKEIADQAKRFTEVRTERAKLEAKRAPRRPRDPKDFKPEPTELPKSPAVGKPIKEIEKPKAPPPVPERPKVDPERRPERPKDPRSKPEDRLDPTRPIDQVRPPDVPRRPERPKDPPDKPKDPPDRPKNPPDRPKDPPKPPDQPIDQPRPPERPRDEPKPPRPRPTRPDRD